eukprot:6472788-Amphidinium_carterae.4
MEQLLHHLESELDAVGLSLCEAKSSVLSTEEPSSEFAKLHQIYANTERHDGLHIAGQYVTEWADTLIPRGTPVTDVLQEVVVELRFSVMQDGMSMPFLVPVAEHHQQQVDTVNNMARSDLKREPLCRTP